MEMRDHETEADRIARDIMVRSRICDLKADCAELTAILESARRPFPVFPRNPREREIALFVQVLRERDCSRRLLALVERNKL
jgi:hypothetical protein